MGSLGRSALISAGAGVCALVAFVARIGVVRFKKTPGDAGVAELVKIYQRGFGADDYAGPEIARRGDAARDELIRMLDTMPAKTLASDETAAIVEILERKFPSAVSLEAVERIRSRLTDPILQGEFRTSTALLRARMSGQWNDEWWKQHGAMEPLVQNLHYTELLMAYAPPNDRVFFLPEAVHFALWASQVTRRGDQERLALETKAETYAHELLAVPDISVKCGDGAYYGNHALGMLALQRGDIATSERHLMETANLPSEKMPNAFPFWPPDSELISGLLARGELDAVLEYLDRFKENPERAPLVGPWKESTRTGRIPNFHQDCLLAHVPAKERARLEREFRKTGDSPEIDH